MRAKVQITVEWELASPDDYPNKTINSWFEAASCDIENCLRIEADIGESTVYGALELVGDPETEPFVRSENLDGEA